MSADSLVKQAALFREMMQAVELQISKLVAHPNLMTPIEHLRQEWLTKPPIYYYLRQTTEDGTTGKPLVTICLVQDPDGNVGRGLAMYKPEPEWPVSKEYGKVLATMRAVWALINQKTGREFRLQEMVKTTKWAVGGKIVWKHSPVDKASTSLLLREGLIPECFRGKRFPKCIYKPHEFTAREVFLMEKKWGGLPKYMDEYGVRENGGVEQ